MSSVDVDQGGYKREGSMGVEYSDVEREEL